MVGEWKSTAMVHVALLSVQILFSGNQVASKLGMLYFHPSVFLLMRCIIVAPILFLLAKLKEKELVPKTRREWMLLVVMAVLSFLSFESFIFGMQVTSVTTGTTLQATSPLFTLLIALALKMEAPSVMKIAGVLCAILGAVISILGNHFYQIYYGNGPQSTSDNKDFPGGLILVFNALCFSGFVTVQKYVLKTVKPVTAAAWNILLCSVLVLFVAAFFFDTVDLGAVTVKGWLAVLYVSLLAMALAYSLLSWAAGQTSTTVVSVYSTIMPVLSPIMGLFFLDEKISLVQVAGMCVTISGVFLVIRARYVEEQKRRLAQSTTTLDDDVTSDSLLKKEVELGMMTEGEKEAGRVGVTFSVNEITNDWLSTSDDENDEISEDGGKKGTKGKKGGYAIVSTDAGELREVMSSA